MTVKLDDIEHLQSVRQVNELLAQMRNQYRKLTQDSAHLLAHESISHSEKVGSQGEELQRKGTILEGRVGHLEEAGEFGLGRAPREAKPVIKIELSKEKEAEIAAMGHYEEPVETNDEII